MARSWLVCCFGGAIFFITGLVVLFGHGLKFHGKPADLISGDRFCDSLKIGRLNLIFFKKKLGNFEIFFLKKL
jgi:hypothetical protein